MSDRHNDSSKVIIQAILLPGPHSALSPATPRHVKDARRLVIASLAECCSLALASTMLPSIWRHRMRGRPGMKPAGGGRRRQARRLAVG